MADQQKVIALTVIHRTLTPGKVGDSSKGIAPTPPKVQIIEPGTVFVAKDQAEFQELMGADAIKVAQPDGETTAAAPQNEGTTTTAKPKDAAAAPTKTDTDENDLV